MTKYSVLHLSCCNHISVFIFGLLLTATLTAQVPADSTAKKMLHRITESELQGWIDTLCSPSFRGRLSGTPEYLAAAAWAASRFDSWGLRPAAGNSSWFRYFPQPYTRVNDPGTLELHLPQKDGSLITKTYSFPLQYYPGMNSGKGSVTAELIFAGHGITAPEHHYDDYAGINVKGKIVLVARDAPFKDSYHPTYAKWVNYCYHQYKLENAVRHGAAGFLYIDGNAANPNISYDSTILVAGIGPEVLHDLFSGTGKSIDSLLNGIAKTLKPSSFSMNKKVTMRMNTARVPNGKSCSVLGLIPGSDPLLKEEVIIIGAHLDAVGGVGDIYVPGGLDNGSGSADVLGVAKVLAGSGLKMKRSVLFILLGGEETGLLGSKNYTENSLFPKEKTRCFINLDMAGNGTAFWLATEDSTLLKPFEEVNNSYIHRDLKGFVSTRENYGRPRSDAVIFRQKGFTTVSMGITGPGKEVFYHLPGDGANAVTPDSMRDLVNWLAMTVYTLANE
ncbi:MAG: M28 family peptidase [Bacteroidales bacterium]